METDVIEKLRRDLEITPQDLYQFRVKHKGPEHYRRLIIEKVGSLIHDLERAALIDGFHFIMHNTLDIRVSVKEEVNVSKVEEIASRYGIRERLEYLGTSGDAPAELYGGIVSQELDHQALTSFSRLLIKLLRFGNFVENEYKGPDREEHLMGIQRLTHQWIHYLYIQQGINNVEQIRQELNDAFNWVRTVSGNIRRRAEELNDRVKSLGGNPLSQATIEQLDNVGELIPLWQQSLTEAMGKIQNGDGILAQVDKQIRQLEER